MKKLLLSLIIAFTAVAANATEWVDVITASGLGVTSTSYTTFSNKTFTSEAVYAGAVACNNGNIQINSSKTACKGIYTTKSGGYVKQVKLYWASSSNASAIYASDKAYSAKPTATKVTEMKYADRDDDGATTYEFTEQYEYVAIYGAIHYLKSVEITWTDGEDDNLADAELSFSAETAQAILGEDFTAPELKNPNKLTVSYTSSNTDVASIDANGALTINGAGTTTITAESSANETYKSGKASYTLTVVDPNNIEFTFDFKNNEYGLTRQSGSQATYEKSWTYTESPITITYTKGTGSGLRLWSDGLRLYSGTLTISVANGYVITGLSLSTSSSFKIEGEKGSTWTGKDNTLTIATTSTSAATIAGITINYTKDDSQPTHLVITSTTDGEEVEQLYSYKNDNYATTAAFIKGSKITVKSLVASKIGVVLPGESEASYYESPYTLAITESGEYTFTDAELLDGEETLSAASVITATAYNPIAVDGSSVSTQNDQEEIDGETVNAIHVMFSITDALGESAKADSYNLYLNDQYLASSEDGDFYIEYLPYTFDAHFAVSPVLEGEEIGRFDVEVTLPELTVVASIDESKTEFAYNPFVDVTNVSLRVYVSSLSDAVYDLEVLEADGHTTEIVALENGEHYIDVNDYFTNVPVEDGAIKFTDEQLSAATESINLVIAPIYKFAVKTPATSRAAEGLTIVTMRGESISLGAVQLSASTGNVSGVEGITVEDNTDAEYFTLQGVRVANPENGVYIRVKSGKASKVAL